MIADLGSSNGVFVNGERIDAPVALYPGDRVLLGDQEIEIKAEGAGRPISQQLEKPAFPDLAALPVDDGGQAFGHAAQSVPGTRQLDFFQLVGRVVDRVLVERRFDEAVTMLQSHLDGVLADARDGKAVSESQRVAALHYAAELAAGTGDRRFVDFALDLLIALRCAPTEDLADEIEEAVVAVGAVDEGRLVAYVTAMEESSNALERLRAATFTRLLQRVARRARPAQR
jgi:pSer/pThr/pTyr-binding forkhead associated (FHA) protein